MKQPKLAKMMCRNIYCRIILLIRHSLSSITRHRLTVQTAQLKLILNKHNKTSYIQTISHLPLSLTCGTVELVTETAQITVLSML